jgi:glycosyltransferase involved in cell wall biosynthesis
MNILHISTPMSWRGGEQQLAYLAEQLEPHINKQVIACAKGGAFEEYARFAHLKTIELSAGILGLYSNSMMIKKLCKGQKIDLIHVHDSKAHTIAYLSAKLGNKVPIIVSRRVDFPVGKNALSRAKYNYPGIKNIICVSEKIKEITGRGIKDKSVLSVVYDGIDVEQLKQVKPLNLHKEFDLPDYYKIVGNIAALAPHKDYFTWVDTAEILVLQNKKIKFLIVGEGPLEEEIREYIQKKGLEDEIIMTGFRRDAKSILAALDVMLISSVTEGLGSSILDAFACGVPVVATAAGGIPEIVIHKQTGLLAPVKATERLAELVLKYIENPALRDTITANARKAAGHYTKHIMAMQTFDNYKSVLVEAAINA